jgi:tetratricopeptide (TPR) repeat protein
MNLPSVIEARARCVLRIFLSLPLAIACASCATAPGPARTGDAARETGPSRAPTEADIVAIEPVRPKIPLTEDLLYQILVAEFAVQRGVPDVAVENYVDLAERTRDPKVVERATRVAVYARDGEAARRAAALWVELDPLNPDPHQVLAVMALRHNEPEKALEHLRNILEHAHGEIDQKLLLIANLLGREQNRELVLQMMEQLMADHAKTPEALYAFAQVAARLGDINRSIALLERTLELEPDNDNAALSYVSLLQREKRTGDALGWLEKTLRSRKGDDFNLRMAYARLLTDARRYDDARRQFEILAVQAPNNVDVQYALGLLYLQSNRLDDAEIYFKRLAVDAPRHDDASYYLGRIAEERKQYEKAGRWYQSVQRGPNYFDAQVRMALITAKQGGVEEARSHLRSIRTRDETEAAILVQAEGELLTEQERYEEAMAVYDRAIEERGHNADLLYARAMLAERMDRLDILERDLRAILEKEPDHPQALNALGYTLADRTTRYDEAYELIKRALELAPDDFYILDSMGWVLYRLGRLDEAQEYLRRAMSIRPDPEIAAHLGEVLWVSGDREAARKVWEAALRETPDDTKLQSVIRRFDP